VCCHCVLPLLCVTTAVCYHCCVLPLLCVTTAVCYPCVLPLCVATVCCHCVLPLCVTVSAYVDLCVPSCVADYRDDRDPNRCC
jgi:hypothetical protein